MKKLAIVIIKIYQHLLSPVFRSLGFQCRFQPTCSEYTIQAVQKYGAVKGLAKGAWRILRCNSYNKHTGLDPL